MQTLQHNHRMITEGTSSATLAKMAGGSALSVIGAFISWQDHMINHLEQVLRMGASVVAIASGIVVIMVALKNRKNRKK